MEDKTEVLMRSTLSACRLCPRQCCADRLSGELGYCGKDAELSVARASLHMWEEPCITGSRGSGTVFFSGCGLRCVYCQNRNIAVGSAGKTISIDRLADIFIELKDKGAHNINLVTACHYVPQVVCAIDRARRGGLDLPVVYNSGGYESVDTLRLLDGYVDVYLPDLKYIDASLAARYSNAADYFAVASEAIAEMVRQTGQFVIDEWGIMQRGVVVRHLALPGCAEDSKRIVRYLLDSYSDKIFISIMNQFTPVGDLSNYPELSRGITDDEYDELIDYAVSLGLENGFIQEGDTALESFIPEFDGEGV